MKKIGLSLLALLCVSFTAQAQIRLVGEKTAKVGEVVRIKAVEFNGDDPKVICTPENTDWEATRNLDGQIVVLLFPKKKGLYTVFVAANKDSKTHTAYHSVDFKSAVPEPDVDPDVPVPPKPQTELYKKLLAAYQVFPDETALPKLIQVYEEVKATNTASGFTSFKDAEAVLVNTTKRIINDDAKLRGVRDVVASHLQKSVGTGGTFVPSKLTTALTEIITELKKVQSGTQSTGPKQTGNQLTAAPGNSSPKP